MRIFIYGQFWKGTLCFSYLEAFKKLGCEVRCFDEVAEYKEVSGLAAYPPLNKVCQPFLISLLNKKFIKEAVLYRPQLCLVMKGQYVLKDALLEIKSRTMPVLFNVNSDDPFNSNPGASSDNVRNALGAFDCYFIWSRLLADRLKAAGLKRVEYLPFAFDPSIHHPGVSAEVLKLFGACDIVFIGNWDKRRQEWLRYLGDSGLAIWGSSYWKSRCRNAALKSKWQGREAYAEELPYLFSSAKISLNILRQQNSGSINMRTFEAPACGAFSLCERSQEAEEFFAEDKEAVYFSTPDELKKKIDYYLGHAQERAGIAQAGYRRCLSSGYTYLERAKSILGVYNSMAGVK